MPCPFHDDSTDSGEPTVTERRGIDRRAFLKSALAIGGTTALATVTDRYGMPASAAPTRGAISKAARANRQHAWDGFETDTSEGGVSAHPAHHVTLHLDYAGTGTPDPGERRTVEAAFRSLERLFAWSSEGLLFTVGYAPAYFDRFDEDLPKGLSPKGKVVKPGLLRPEDLIETAGVTLDHEDPDPDRAEICLHLASNHVQNILAAEALLWGEAVDVDGRTRSFDDSLDGILTSAGPEADKPTIYPYRRVGFAGHEPVTDRLENDTDFDPDRVPDDAELMMGFNDLYRNSIPREDNVTMFEDQQLVEPHPPGVFAQGTIQHVSKLDIDLDRFYDENDADKRRKLMFSADHTAGNTGTVGENLGTSNAPGDTPMREAGTDSDKGRETVADFEDEGVVGHAQKLARARFDLESRFTDEGRARLSGGGPELLPAEERPDDLPGHDGDQTLEQVILRRDVTSTDEGEPGNLFVALMRFNPYMAYVRQAMNGVAFDSEAFGLTGEDRIQHDAIGAGPDSGIANYLETERRGNYLVPPLTQRALPHPRGETVAIEVDRVGDTYRVAVDGLTEADLADGSVRFGWFYDVNRARGAEPRMVVSRGDRTLAAFPARETGIDDAPGGPDGDVRVRLFAKRADTGRPVRGTATVPGDYGSRSGGTGSRSGGTGSGSDAGGGDNSGGRGGSGGRGDSGDGSGSRRGSGDSDDSGGSGRGRGRRG